MNISTF